MKTNDSFFNTLSQDSIERSQLNSVRGGTGGVLRDEDILLPDPEPGDKAN